MFEYVKRFYPYIGANNKRGYLYQMTWMGGWDIGDEMSNVLNYNMNTYASVSSITIGPEGDKYKQHK